MIKVVYGIDPDIERSGVACKRGTDIETYRLSFFDLYDRLKAEKRYSESPKGEPLVNLEVRIEAGWLNAKSQFRGNYAKNVSERIAKNVGANHQTGKLICEMCCYLDIPYTLIRPTTKKWDERFCKMATGLDIKNKDVRDAVKLVV
jgi:hypothetical protein